MTLDRSRPGESGLPPAIKTFAILNPQSGSCTPAAVRLAIGEHLRSAEVVIHEVNEGDDLPAILRDALARGFDPIIAAGGDGTVSTVANALVGTQAHLIIFPLGTANVLARELGIPIDLDGACKLSAGRVAPGSLAGKHHEIVEIDAMRVQGRHYFTQIGVGIDSIMIRDTAVEHKRRFGRLAYLWTAVIALIGFRSRRFFLTIDGATLKRKASQVLVANTGMMGQPGLRWGPDIQPDDAKLDVCIARGKSLLDFGVMFWHVLRRTHQKSPNVRYLVATQSVIIEAKPPLPVQADGEILGTTPVVIEVVPKALKIVVPVPDSVAFGKSSGKAAKPD